MGQDISSPDHENGESEQSQHQLNQNSSPRKDYSSLHYELVNIIHNDERYGGELKIYKDPSLLNRMFAQKTLVFDDQQSYEIEKQQQQFQQSLNHENLVGIYETKLFETKDFCSHHYTIQYYLEYFEKDVFKQIQENQRKNFFFSQFDIQKFVRQITSCLKYLQEKNIYHGRIQPKTVFITSDQNFKIVNNQFLTQRTSYQQMIINLEQHLYVCPDLFSQLHNKVMQPILKSQEKSDVFSLGLVALQMATNENMDSIYDYSSGTVKSSELNLLLTFVDEKFSYKLYHLLSNMLKISGDQRFSYQQILDQLNDIKNDNNINNYNRQQSPKFLPNNKLHDDLIEQKELQLLKQSLSHSKNSRQSNSPTKDRRSPINFQNEYTPISHQNVEMERYTPQSNRSAQHNEEKLYNHRNIKHSEAFGLQNYQLDLNFAQINDLVHNTIALSNNYKKKYEDFYSQQKIHSYNDDNVGGHHFLYVQHNLQPKTTTHKMTNPQKIQRPISQNKNPVNISRKNTGSAQSQYDRKKKWKI